MQQGLNYSLKEGLDDRQLMMLESEMNRRSVNPIIAWLLWLFLGTYGGHAFYLGNKPKGFYYIIGLVVSYLLCFVIIGFLGLFIIFMFWIYDAIIMGKEIDKKNNEIELEIIRGFKLPPTPMKQPETDSTEEPVIEKEADVTPVEPIIEKEADVTPVEPVTEKEADVTPVEPVTEKEYENPSTEPTKEDK